MNAGDQSPKPPRVLIVEELLRDRQGHIGNFVLSIAEYLAERGAAVKVWGHRDALPDLLPAPIKFERVFTHVWVELVYLPKRSARVAGVLVHNLRFLAVLARNGAIFRPPPLVIAASANLYQFLAWRIWLALTPRRSRLVLILFQQPWLTQTEATGRMRLRESARVYRRVLRWFGDPVRSGRCCIAGETELHARLISLLAGLRCVVVPIPLPAELLRVRAPQSSRPPGSPLRFGALGRAAADKGFGCLLDMIERWHSTLAVRFVIQWEEHPSSPAEWKERVFALVRTRPGLVELVGKGQSVADYANLVASLDGLLLPYRLADYVGRLSNLAIDAFCVGVPIVCTAGSGIEEAMRRWGAGVVCRDQDADSLADAVERLARDHEALAARAAERAVAARREHGCEHFFAQVAPGGLEQATRGRPPGG